MITKTKFLIYCKRFIKISAIKGYDDYINDFINKYDFKINDVINYYYECYLNNNIADVIKQDIKDNYIIPSYLVNKNNYTFNDINIILDYLKEYAHHDYNNFKRNILINIAIHNIIDDKINNNTIINYINFKNIIDEYLGLDYEAYIEFLRFLHMININSDMMIYNNIDYFIQNYVKLYKCETLNEILNFIKHCGEKFLNNKHNKIMKILTNFIRLECKSYNNELFEYSKETNKIIFNENLNVYRSLCNNKNYDYLKNALIIFIFNEMKNNNVIKRYNIKSNLELHNLIIDGINEVLI